MTRFDELAAATEHYQALAKENYDGIRALAQAVRDGLCAYLDARDGECVRLVPPAGPFEPRNYGDDALSMPPRGFRLIAPIAFGLAVRVSRGTDWMRLTLVCTREGANFRVDIEGGDSHTFPAPFRESDHPEFFEMLFNHVLGFYAEGARRFVDGEYGSQTIGFDFNVDVGRIGAPQRRPSVRPTGA